MGTPTDDGDGTDDRDTTDDDTDHLDGLADGAGCAEVWEHLSEGETDDDRAAED